MPVRLFADSPTAGVCTMRAERMVIQLDGNPDFSGKIRNLILRDELASDEIFFYGAEHGRRRPIAHGGTYGLVSLPGEAS
jgi:hypothetical protein